VVVKVKPIKPGKFQDDKFWFELMAGADEVADGILADYRKTTATWNRRVEFVKHVESGKEGIVIWIDTDDEIYAYVDKGTKGPYIILPKKPGGVLVFQSQFIPKTKPGVIGSTSGFVGGDTVFSAGVIHPGITPRRFTEVIAKKWEKPFRTTMEKALARARKASGYEA